MDIETRRVGFLQRIAESIKGVVVGLVLFIASFVVLYVNEGVPKLVKIIDNAAEIFDGENSAEGVVTYTGIVTTDSPVGGDGAYITGGNFLSLQRKVEVFSWIEITETRSQTELGGSEVQTTEYRYIKDWTENPVDSSLFRTSEGHENLPKQIDSYNAFASNVNIGSYPISRVREIGLHNYRPISFNEVEVLDGEVFNEKLFITREEGGTPLNPEIGDYRISYEVIRLNTEMTFVGALRGGELRAHSRTPKAFELFDGDREDAYVKADEEDTLRIWQFRILGFVLMTAGLILLIKPFVVLLSVVPIFGTVSMAVVSVVAILISMIMTIVTILVSIIAHNILALIIVILATLLATFLFFYKGGLSNSKKSS